MDRCQGGPPFQRSLPLALRSAGQRPRASPGSSRLVLRPGSVVILSLLILYVSCFFIPQMRFPKEGAASSSSHHTSCVGHVLVDTSFEPCSSGFS